MVRAYKACGSCGTPSPKSTCPDCKRAKNRERARTRGTRQDLGYDQAWMKLRAEAIRRQPYCTDCGATTDLTGDHVLPKSTHPERRLDPANVVVRCRSCNSKKGTTQPDPKTTLPPSATPDNTLRGVIPSG